MGNSNRTSYAKNMKRLAIILSLVSLLIGSAVSPAYSFTDKCPTTKKFKEVDRRTLQMMKKNLSKYVGQAFVLQADVGEFVGENQFRAYWFGKGKDQTYSQAVQAAGWDVTKTLKRISHLAENDTIKAKVILVSEGIRNEIMPVFSVCSATRIKEIS